MFIFLDWIAYDKYPKKKSDIYTMNSTNIYLGNFFSGVNKTKELSFLIMQENALRNYLRIFR